ncbi:hypothetical protein EYF80_056385 [Liparis tanakae]|uniref:Uncharacterized protein n=1 Tax=Liparis tanakae TaxID=230148 RepID=A0A4Z2EXH1_9TELE|nr:hypothetical protein EYF80_056385 [Liparis tanakae]
MSSLVLPSGLKQSDNHSGVQPSTSIVSCLSARASCEGRRARSARSASCASCASLRLLHPDERPASLRSRCLGPRADGGPNDKASLTISSQEQGGERGKLNCQREKRGGVEEREGWDEVVVVGGLV